MTKLSTVLSKTSLFISSLYKYQYSSPLAREVAKRVPESVKEFIYEERILTAEKSLFEVFFNKADMTLNRFVLKATEFNINEPFTLLATIPFTESKKDC